MSKLSRGGQVRKFEFSTLNKHWHGRELTKSLGCQGCVFHGVCGGIHVEAPVFDCMTYCRCEDPASCDNVCPRNAAYYVARVHEVKGLEFGNVLSAPAIESPVLPLVTPLIYHGKSRKRSPAASTVALSLYHLFKRDGSVKFNTRRALLEHFKLKDDTTVILTGTQEDFLIERWWGLPNREAVTRSLKALGVAMITTPNYSLFGDVPRLDNLFNMKRIALVWSEIQREGMPCALHLNARTDRDYERWVEFLRDHPEITHVAFEFGTGAGAVTRLDWHVDQLSQLAKATGRPLHLIVRGGTLGLRALRSAFAGLTFIDTGSFVKTQRRQRLIDKGPRLRSQRAPTHKGEPLDDLLDHNVAVSRAFIERQAAQ